MTEQEMMQTWCPHTQLVERDDRTLISSGSYEKFRPHGSANCIGRRCSQWRWVKVESAGTVVPEGTIVWMTGAWQTRAIEPRRPSYITDEWKWDSVRAVWTLAQEFPDQGFCGLSGAP